MAMLLIGVVVAAALAAAVAARRLVWRRTPLDPPLAGLLALVALQIAVGNRALAAWALAPPAPPSGLVADFPAPLLAIGSVTPRLTLESGLIFAGYAAVYYAVVNLVRTRSQVGLFVRALVVGGGVVAFAALIDFLSGHAWLLDWGRDRPLGSRLSGAFFNPDHFGAWLAMLALLGMGWLAARSDDARRAPGLAAFVSVHALREQAFRRYLPLVAVVVMAVALVFTLSRGGLLNLAAGLLAFLALLALAGKGRRSLVLTGALLVAVGAYGGWIGFGPLLERLEAAGLHFPDRWTATLTTLPILRDFPVFGIGLGGYPEVYFRYQPSALRPEDVWWANAHNDLAQLAVELGPLGIALALLFAWRALGDLVLAHLAGRGACPVDGGEGDEARRSDRYSVGIAVGALAGVAGLVAHSAFDFSMRVPAVGVAAAALLGLATVALHTRLVPHREQLLTATATLPLAGRGRAAGVTVAAVTGLLLVGWSAWWLRAGAVGSGELRLARLSGPAAVEEARAILALDGGSIPALRARALAASDAAIVAWYGPPAGDRAAAARRHLAGARRDFRAALAVAPTDPYFHNALAWVEATQAVVDGRSGVDALRPALAHVARAIALAPENALFYASMARIAAHTAPALGLRAAREALLRRPELLAALVDVYRTRGLTEAEWLAMVPDAAIDRLELARALDAWGLGGESLAAYRAAVERAAPREAAVYRWALGLALGRRGLALEAAASLRLALAADPDNAELELALGEALARLDDPAALAHLRRAAASAAATSGANRAPFGARAGRLAAQVASLAADAGQPARYHRALARHLSARRLWEPARAEWEWLARARPRDAEAQFGIAEALHAAGDRDAALERYRAAVQLDRRAAYRARLAERLWQSEQYYQAINEWRVVAQQEPRNLAARLGLARAYEKVGERVEAYRQYRAILELRPGEPEAARAVARLEGRAR